MAATPQKSLRAPIILVLGDLGGTASKATVLDEIEERGLITPMSEDREIASSGEERWRNRAAWERHQLVNEDLLSASTPGQWTLTSAGWRLHAQYTEDVNARETGTRNPRWEWDEVVLALDTFVTSGCLNGGALPGRDHPAIVQLSEELHRLPLHAASARGRDFRNPAGVALKLANLRALERDTRIRLEEADADRLPAGMRAFSRLDRAVFDTYFGDWASLRTEADHIRATEASPDDGAPTAEPTQAATDAPVDGGGASEYEASPANGGTRTRSEADLVQRYADYMKSLGHEVTGRHYAVNGESRVLRADLLLRELNTLVEAKAAATRTNIRLAIGQLFDYRRFESGEPNLAVLLPEAPASDLLTLLTGLSINCVWPVTHGFEDTCGGALTGNGQDSGA